MMIMLINIMPFLQCQQFYLDRVLVACISGMITVGIERRI